MAELFNRLYLLLGEIDYIAFLLFVFAGVALFVGSVSYLISRRNEMKFRLARFVPQSDVNAARKTNLTEQEGGSFVTRMTKPLLQKVAAPPGGDSLRRVRRRLAVAGLRTNRAYRIYLSSKFFLGFLLPLGYLFGAVNYQISLQLVAIGIGSALLGFFLPDLVIFYLTQRRKTEITQAFPDSLDLMVVCAEAGLGLDMTFKRVGDEIRPMSTSLSDEFYLTNMEIRAGKPRNESLKRMSERTGVPEVNNLMSLLAQANRFGTSIARTLRVHSEAMRIKRRQVAETKAAKLAVKLIFPLVAFIFPSLFIVLLGPAALKIYRHLLPHLGGGN